MYIMYVFMYIHVCRSVVFTVDTKFISTPFTLGFQDFRLSEVPLQRSRIVSL